MKSDDPGTVRFVEMTGNRIADNLAELRMSQ